MIILECEWYLLNIGWHKVISIELEDPNKSFKAFDGKVNELIDEYIPLKSYRERLKTSTQTIDNKGGKRLTKRREKIYRMFINAKNCEMKEKYEK